MVKGKTDQNFSPHNEHQTHQQKKLRVLQPSSQPQEPLPAAKPPSIEGKICFERNEINDTDAPCIRWSGTYLFVKRLDVGDCSMRKFVLM